MYMHTTRNNKRWLECAAHGVIQRHGVTEEFGRKWAGQPCPQCQLEEGVPMEQIKTPNPHGKNSY
jgi:hypothetical protein